MKRIGNLLSDIHTNKILLAHLYTVLPTLPPLYYLFT